MDTISPGANRYVAKSEYPVLCSVQTPLDLLQPRPQDDFMEFIVGAVQPGLEDVQSDSAPRSDRSNRVFFSSRETEVVVASSALLPSAGYVLHDEIMSCDSLNNPFDKVSREDYAKHLPLQNFIPKVNLAKDLVSSLGDRHLTQQCIGLITDLQRLSEILTQILTFHKGVKVALWDESLRDAIWKSQKTLVELLQLPGREQHAGRLTSPSWQKMRRRVARQTLSIGVAAGLHAEIASHVHAITMKFDKVKKYASGLSCPFYLSELIHFIGDHPSSRAPFAAFHTPSNSFPRLPVHLCTLMKTEQVHLYPVTHQHHLQQPRLSH